MPKTTTSECRPHHTKPCRFLPNPSNSGARAHALVASEQVRQNAVAKRASTRRGSKTTMAAQARLRATDSGRGGDNESNALASAVLLCLLHDLVGAAAFLASHPIHAAYLLFFARHLATLAAFFCPLLVSTTLLHTVLATVGGAEWPGVRSLGRTCGIAVAALRAELQPDGGRAGLVGQLCSFVLGPGDAAAVDRVGEIMGELCDITGSCFLLEEEQKEKSLFLLLGGEDEECKEPAFALPLTDDAIEERSILDHEDSGEGEGEIDDKVVVSEYLKCSSYSDGQRWCQSEARFVQDMKAEDDPEVVIRKQGLVSSEKDDGVGDIVMEKRLECDPVSVDIKKCQPVQGMELEAVKKRELAQAAVEVKVFQPVVEPTGMKTRELVKPRSSIAQRIKLWEAQVSGNFKTATNIENKEDGISVKFSSESSESVEDVKKYVPLLEADPCVQTCHRELKAQDVVTSTKQSVEREQGPEFKDVKECVPSETETFSGIIMCSSPDSHNGPASHPEQVPGDVQSDEAELQAEECEAEQDLQKCKVGQPEQDLQEKVEYKDVPESPVRYDESRESSPKPTSIVGRVHSRSTSENLLVVGEGSPSSHKEKVWKRTLACKLYEERMQLKLCRDRAVVEGGSDNMDMLWEAYEVGGGGGSGVKQVISGVKAKKSSKKVEELVDEGGEEELEEQDDDDEDGNEGSVRQLCCLQALKFSTKKMSFRAGKPSFTKISKILKGMAALSRVGSRRGSHKE